MKTLLVGINAKFIHSNLAIRYLRDYAYERGETDIYIKEFTINQRVEQILPEIYLEKPDLIGFSCYIWNFGIIKQLISELKKVLPHCTIFLGGPEVSYNAEQVLNGTNADIIVCGEGEKPVYQLINTLASSSPLHNVQSIVYRTSQGISKTEPAPFLSMDELPFVYHNMANLEHKIIYFESSRGCPFSCQYCLSSNEHHVRFMSLEKVYAALDFFLGKKVRQVKFVDRTFNCDKKYAMSIWRYLHEHDNGYTNFHFEIAAELLDDEMLAFLKTIRRGQFQFEIGVQSTNLQTLTAIKRITKLPLLRHIVGSLKQGENIHLHLDLIIGLPHEDYQSFCQSFNDVYSLSPDQLQVGFLKLLKGSGLYDNASKFGIVCSEYPPYEILYTDVLSFDDVLSLKTIEEMVETYYNSGRFQKTVAYLASLFTNPFSFFESLAQFYVANQYHLISHSNVQYYTILHDFFVTLKRGSEETFQWLAKFDLYSHEKAKKIPDWLTQSLESQYRNLIYHFFDTPEKVTKYLPDYEGLPAKIIARQAHIEVFPFSPITLEQKKTAVLFRYLHTDLLGNAEYTIIDLEELKQ